MRSAVQNLGALLECGLEAVGASASEIKGVAINVGPGSLTFVRAGISFVNALAFSLNVSIYPFNWFEIIAEQTRERRSCRWYARCRRRMTTRTLA